MRALANWSGWRTRQAVAALVSCLAAGACSTETTPTDVGGAGDGGQPNDRGGTSSGGFTGGVPGTGGAPTTGGTVAAAGGVLSTAGTSSTGGRATGGANTGGRAGAATTGGANTAGTNEGGRSGGGRNGTGGRTSTGGAISTAGVNSTSGAGGSDELAQEYVDAHNAVRAAVEEPTGYSGTWAPLPDVTWSAAIAAGAQTWAEHLRDTADCGLTHSSGSGFGENLAGGTHLSPAGAVELWAREKKDYTYNPKYEFVAGHYTQIVWRKSTLIGCGSATCGNSVVICCRYSPPGNVIGQQPY